MVGRLLSICPRAAMARKCKSCFLELKTTRLIVPYILVDTEGVDGERISNNIICKQGINVNA